MNENFSRVVAALRTEGHIFFNTNENIVNFRIFLAIVLACQTIYDIANIVLGEVHS